MRWLGHSDIMREIVAQWAALGDLPSEDPFAAKEAAQASAAEGASGSDAADAADSAGGEEAEGGGSGGGSGGAGGEAASEGGGSTARERRQEAIGKIVHRERRLAAEFSNLQRGSKLDIEVGMAGDELDHWLVRLRQRHFSSDTGLHEDLGRLSRDWPGGVDHILLEVFFPRSYPRDPPFVRVVYPRFAWRTGHVTWGGSICLETLVNTGSPSGYNPSLTFETILLMIMFNLTSDTEGTVVKAGRIDFHRTSLHASASLTSRLTLPLAGERDFDRLDYSLQDGLENFLRIAKDHGWDKQLESARKGAASADEKPAAWEELEGEFAARASSTATTSFK